MEDQEPSKVETIHQSCESLRTSCGRQHFYPFHTMNRHLAKKIVDFDPTFMLQFFNRFYCITRFSDKNLTKKKEEHYYSR